MMRTMKRLRAQATCPWVWILGASVLGGVWLLGCSADESAGADGSSLVDEGDPGFGGDGDASGGVDSDGIGFGGAGSGIPDLPPLPEEVEDDSSYRAPVATGRYLWSTNPESGRVALIDVQDLSTQVLSAGLYPTFLVSVGTAEAPAALVLNVGSSDATRFRVTPGEVVLRDTVPLHVGGNRWAAADSGKWAVAWSRPEAGVTLDPTDGFQEITVISLADEVMVPTRLTVGYRPSQVVITEDDKRLIVVSEEGISLIDLTSKPRLSEWIDLGLEADSRDVSINREGTIALVRRADESTALLIDLLNPENEVELTFSGPLTDLDLADNGRAVAVVRTRSELATFTISDALADPTKIDTLNIPGEVFGSAELTADGKTAVLYTNALLNNKINIVDLRASSFLEHRSHNTQAPVYSVTTSPDGAHAVVLAAAETLTLGDQGKPAEAFSVVALRNERFPRIVGTAAPVVDVALGNSFGLVTTSSPATGIYEAYLVELPGLSVTPERLSTEPLAAGVIAELGIAYAAQAHSEGRLTFFDLETDQARTLTGFELSAEVVDE